METQKNLIWKSLIMLLAFPTLVYSQTLYVPSGLNGIGTSTTGNVGIGNSGPLGKLHINPTRPIIMDNNGGSGVYGEHIGFNTTLNTGVDPNTITKLGGTVQQGGALITVDYTGNMAFQMYDAGTELVSTVNYVPQIVFTNTGKLSVNGAIEVGVDKIPIQETNFGYSSTWKVLRLGLNQANRSLALNVDPLGITGSNFAGNGQILIGNNGILAPDNAGTNWMGVLRATGGKIYLGGSLSSGDLVGDGLVVSSGYVGIGIIPNNKLHVAGVTRVDGDILLGDADNIQWITANTGSTDLKLGLTGGGNVPKISLYGNIIYTSGTIETNAYPGIRLTHADAQIRFHGGTIEKWALGSTGAAGDNFILADMQSGTERMTFDATNGNVSIGSAALTEKLNVGGNVLSTGNFISLAGTSAGGTSHFGLRNNNVWRHIIGLIGSESGANSGSDFAIWDYNDDGSFLRTAFFINRSSGNVGIGTTTVSEKLTVNGKILAEEVQVVLNVPDYVFAKEYKLKTLSEVSKFINEHKHLPEVPSEKEVLDNGGQVGLGEMNMTLLKKIEELTLYAIEQENNIKEQENNIKEQKENIQKQDEVIKELLIQNETILKRVTELEKK